MIQPVEIARVSEDSAAGVEFLTVCIAAAEQEVPVVVGTGHFAKMGVWCITSVQLVPSKLSIVKMTKEGIEETTTLDVAVVYGVHWNERKQYAAENQQKA